MNRDLINIRSLSIEELTSHIEKLGEKKFRAKQIYEWLWKKNARSFDSMSDLSLNLREKLNSSFYLDLIELKSKQISTDKTVKCAYSVQEGKVIEGVLIPTSKRMTACISSQIGCSLSCSFCATGKLKLLRNLSVGEIVDQVVHLKQEATELYNINLSNIVLMGMGEPLLNYKNVLSAIEVLTSKVGLGMSPRRITLSTAGVAKMIKKLGDDEVKFNLALSLHAANDEKRNTIMEINETNNLESLKDALIYFHQKTGTRVTLEYILLNDFNDSKADAQNLVEFCKEIPVKVNLIEYNSIDDALFSKSSQAKTDSFIEILEQNRVIVNFRRSRGKDIDAACGQLANKNEAINLSDRQLKLVK